MHRRIHRLPVLLALVLSSAACEPAITRVSLTPAGAQLDADAYAAGLSDDGATAVIATGASNLGGPALPIGWRQDYVWSRAERSFRWVDPGAAGLPFPTAFFDEALSADGRWLAVASGEAVGQIYLYDLSTMTALQVSRVGWVSGNGTSAEPSVSADGRFVAFSSHATNLVAAPSGPAVQEVLLWDRDTGRIERMSQSTAGEPANGDSSGPSISADGQLVAFGSAATNLDPRDTDSHSSIFLRDRGAATTKAILTDEGGMSYAWPRISDDANRLTYSGWACPPWFPLGPSCDYWVFVTDRRSHDTLELVGSYYGPGVAPISADGRFVAFSTYATLAPSDTNDGGRDVYVDDLSLGKSVPATHSLSTGLFDDSTSVDDLSGDGRLMSISAYDRAGLVEGDTNGFLDAYLVRNPLLP